MKQAERVYVVVIGRNEGSRLVNCLTSLVKQIKHIVYIDSGSTDKSLSEAEKLGVHSISLDLSIPFTAARARNEGAEYILQNYPECEFIQFIDGDCEISDNWISNAIQIFDQLDDTAIVCGQLKERYPEHSVYNFLCDLEWSSGIGEVQECGGIFMIRAFIFKNLTGFNPKLIAGEEPELCFRIRKSGWKIIKIKYIMALHDANITSFKQWWKRSIRSGYAYAEGMYMYGLDKERFRVINSIRIWVWAAFIPISSAILTIISPLFLLLFSIYPLQVIRIARREKINGKPNWAYGFFMTLVKFPEMQGQLKFWFDKLFNSQSKIIEYQ